MCVCESIGRCIQVMRVYLGVRYVSIHAIRSNVRNTNPNATSPACIAMKRLFLVRRRKLVNIKMEKYHFFLNLSFDRIHTAYC